MKKTLNNYLVKPSILASLLIVATPYGKIFIKNNNLHFNPTQIKDNKVSTFLDDIIDSFGSPASAECNAGSGFICSMEDQCAAESSIYSIKGSIQGYTGSDIIGYNLRESSTSNYLSPKSYDSGNVFNNYPTNPPQSPSEVINIDQPFSMPAVGPTDGINGRITIPMEINPRKAYYDYYGEPPGWSSDIYDYEVGHFTLTVDHVNQAPVLSNIQPTTTDITLSPNQSSYNLPVSFSVSDVENNTFDIILELGNSDFSTINQTYTFYHAIGGDFNYTFSNLTPGDYYWKVKVIEKDAKGYCTGFVNAVSPTNLSIQSESFPVSIKEVVPSPTPTAPPTSSPTVTVIPTPTPTVITPSPTVTIIPTTPTATPKITPTITITPTPTTTKSTISGTVFLDNNKNGTKEEDEPYLANVTLIITDSNGNETKVETDQNGYYEVSVNPGNIKIQLDKSDPDLANYNLVTTNNDIMELNVVSNQNNLASPIGVSGKRLLQNTGHKFSTQIFISISAVFSVMVLFALSWKRRNKVN